MISPAVKCHRTVGATGNQARLPCPCFNRRVGQSFGRSRGGMVMFVAIACLGIAALVFLAILKTAVAERSAIETRHRLEQAGWLAESGLERAAARLAADPTYGGETWSVPAAELDGKAGAAVRIRVEPIDGRADRRLVRVEADYPDAPHHRARRSKQAFIDVPPSG